MRFVRHFSKLMLSIVAIVCPAGRVSIAATFESHWNEVFEPGTYQIEIGDPDTQTWTVLKDQTIK